MKALVVLVATLALLVLMVSYAAAFEPNSPATVLDGTESIPSPVDSVLNGSEFELNSEPAPDSSDLDDMRKSGELKGAD